MKKFILICTAGVAISMAAYGQKADSKFWRAPDWADTLLNKYTSKQDIESGKENFEIYCAMCHGELGLGDGAAGGGLEIPPRNFTEKAVVAQKDGALYWKLTNGKEAMAAYKDILPLEDRWRIISYIRELQEPEKKDE